MRRAVAALAGGGGCAAAGFYGYQWYQRNGPPPTSSALQPNRSLPCKLRDVKKLTPDTSRFRFELPTPEHVLGLPVCSHILAVDNAMVARAYTPTTLDQFEKGGTHRPPPTPSGRPRPDTERGRGAAATGYFDLVVKRYPNGYFSEWSS